MRITNIVCDRCRRPVGDGGSLIRAAGAIRELLGELDLCGPCGRELIAWLRGAAMPADDRGPAASSSSPRETPSDAWPLL
ncbi:MAG: hypothetical protein ACYC61_31650 [Isosphaeraceae bacterium]